MTVPTPSYRPHTLCRSCHSPLPRPYLDLGDQPMANALLDGPDDPYEAFPLAVACCQICLLSQLTVVVDPALMFSHYLYVTGSNPSLRDHFHALAHELARSLSLSRDSLAVDIGCNDGTFLQSLRDACACAVVGVEPAANLALETRSQRGIPVMQRYWDRSTAQDIRARYSRPADLITACNVFAHLDDIRGFMKAVDLLLAPNGVLVIEVANIADMMIQHDAGPVYHEHVTYWSLHTLVGFMPRLGFSVVDAEHLGTHGGSVRVHVRRGSHGLSERGLRLLTWESEFATAHTYRGHLRFGDAVRRHRLDFIRAIRTTEGRVVGYTAPARATTLLNYCGMDSDDIAYIVEDSHLKRGKYIPGTGIRIRDPELFRHEPPAAIVLFAWELAPRLIPRLRQALDTVPPIILPFPTVQVVSPEEAEKGAAHGSAGNPINDPYSFI